MMKKQNLWIASLGMCAAAALTLGAEAADKPNVVIIYGDDVGYGDVGVYGSTMIPTPNIDALAHSGLKLTDAHCSAATCTPSRYAMLTGKLGERDRVGVLRGDAKMTIPTDVLTLPKLFQANGYKTAVFGKWHLGLGDGEAAINWNEAVKPGPLEIGFDYSFLCPSTNDRVPSVYLKNHHVVNLDPNDPITVSYSGPIPDDVPGTEYPDGKVDREAMTYYQSTHGHNNSVINGIGRIGYMKGGKSALWNDEDISDVLIGEVTKYIAENKDDPFFIYFASQDIHVPRTPHKRFQGKTELGYRGDAMVQFDWTTGEIMKALEQNGLRDNTIIIFSSDNGPVYDDGYDDGTTVRTSTKASDGGHFGAGPLRGGKYQLYEGGTRVPTIVSWPAKIKAGSESAALLSQVDLLASFAQMLDFEIPAGDAMDSQANIAAWLGQSETGNEYIVEEAQAYGWALRHKNWKYIPAKKKKKQGSGELYNLADDIGEEKNLAEQHPERVKQMQEKLEQLKTKGLR
ncbi:sulfatase family protein [Persicirhabdus sediminis]|nr:arylsulfatase [Persicirhabdus sediminis]